MPTSNGTAECDPRRTAAHRSPRSGADAEICDIVGIGFGPANLSLAIAIEEHNNRTSGRPVTARFLEAKPQFGWHDGMLLPGATMQISFLKDLVSPREVVSEYTFLNYLLQNGRLQDFINLKTFFPTREEFRDYLCWAASRTTVPVEFGRPVTGVEWVGDSFEVTTAGPTGPAVARARHIALGLGLEPIIPAPFEASTRVFHNHRILEHLSDLPERTHRRFVVVGSGQSAAEVAAYLHATYPDSEVHASFRRFGYSPSDDSPYANRIFDPEAVDEFFTSPPELKRKLLDYHSLTNYSAVDSELIEEIYRNEYRERVTGARRLFVHRMTEPSRLEHRPDGVSIELEDLGARRPATRIDADAVVFATGFRARDIRELLGESVISGAVFDGDEAMVGRDYRLDLPDTVGNVYLNGGVQHSHGLTSSLLSNVAVRAGEILQSVLLTEVGLPASAERLIETISSGAGNSAIHQLVREAHHQEGN